jgi:putative oxidoreductase
MKPLSLSFLPRSADFGLLFLRLWFGLSMLVDHGWDKLVHFSTYQSHFGGPLPGGATANLAVAVICEVVCAILLAVGCLTRLAALLLAIEMAIAFDTVHHLALHGPMSGEPAFLYFGAFATIFFAGSGKLAACPD